MRVHTFFPQRFASEKISPKSGHKTKLMYHYYHIESLRAPQTFASSNSIIEALEKRCDICSKLTIKIPKRSH